MAKEKYVLQSYKEQRKIYPYETTTAYYYGPKLDFTTKGKKNESVARKNKHSKRNK